LPGHPATCPLAAAALTAAIACAGTEPNTPLPDCALGIAISVGAGVHPEFDWTPLCGITYLAVTLPDTGPILTTLWSVGSPTGNFGPPVRYGTPPPGTREISKPEDLIPGATYLLYLTHGHRRVADISDTVTFTVR